MGMRRRARYQMPAAVVKNITDGIPDKGRASYSRGRGIIENRPLSDPPIGVVGDMIKLPPGIPEAGDLLLWSLTIGTKIEEAQEALDAMKKACV